MLRAARGVTARVSAGVRGAHHAAPVGPVSFQLSEDQKSLQQLARKFAVEEMYPRAAEYDRTMAYPRDIFNKVRGGGSAGRGGGRSANGWPETPPRWVREGVRRRGRWAW
jgi:alkylation response protein AidB-like acyl-CoA dehydrogenase